MKLSRNVVPSHFFSFDLFHSPEDKCGLEEWKKVAKK
jgi:hypothetical protein